MITLPDSNPFFAWLIWFHLSTVPRDTPVCIDCWKSLPPSYRSRCYCPRSTHPRWSGIVMSSVRSVLAFWRRSQSRSCWVCKLLHLVGVLEILLVFLCSNCINDKPSKDLLSRFVLFKADFLSSSPPQPFIQISSDYFSDSLYGFFASFPLKFVVLSFCIEFFFRHFWKLQVKRLFFFQKTQKKLGRSLALIVNLFSTELSMETIFNEDIKK